MRILLILVLLAAISACNKEPENSLKGSWKVKEIHWQTPDTTYSITKAQPGIFMVDKEVYSFIWTPINESRKPFKKLAQPTQEEMIYGFQSIVLNAGLYKKTDSMFSIEAMVAKVPGFEGGKQVFTYTVDKDDLQLTMIDETYPDGTKPAWYGKLKTRFVLERLH